MVNKIQEIATGWFYDLFKNEKIEESAKIKFNICVNCPLFSKGTEIKEKNLLQKSLPNDYYCNQEKQIDVIKGCSCPINKKVRSNGSCPRKLW